MSIVHDPRERYPRSRGSNATTIRIGLVDLRTRSKQLFYQTPSAAVETAQSNADHCHTDACFRRNASPKTKTPRRMALIGMRNVSSKRWRSPAVARRFQSFFHGRNPRNHRAEPSEIKPSGSSVVAAVKLRTPGTRNSLIYWCRLRDLNPRPSVYKTAALPLC
jgi:hypothetical protein